MEPRRYLRCLGQPTLLAPNGEPVRFRTKKHLALLIYIAVDARPHRRELLAELLWPRVSLIEARHSLATALSTLRPRLGPGALETSRDHVRLVPDRVELDLQRLEAGDVLGTEITGPLEVARFLDGFDIPDSLEFTHWKDRQQARFLPLIKDALVVLIDRCRRTGNSRQIEQLADRMLVLGKLSEEAISATMEARPFACGQYSPRLSLSNDRVFESYTIAKRNRFWQVLDSNGELVCLTVYRRGAQEVVRRLYGIAPANVGRGDHAAPTVS